MKSVFWSTVIFSMSATLANECPPTPTPVDETPTPGPILDGVPSWSANLPDLALSQKQVNSSIDLDNYVSDSDTPDSSLTLSVSGGSTSTVSASISSSTHVLTLTAAASFAGEVTLTLTAQDPEGHTDALDMKVKVHANRSCSTSFSYDSKIYGTVSSIAVAGDFNQWSPTANPMTNNGSGVYTASVSLSTGYYQYKLVRNGSDWIQDPSNPLTAWEGGYENSEVKVEDCHSPLLSVKSLDSSSSSITAQFYFEDSSDGYGMDDSSFVATYHDGSAIPATSFSVDNYTRVMTISLRGLSPDQKYTLWVNAKDSRGTAASSLFVPIWLSSSNFTWNDATMYFPFTDRFVNGSTSNDRPISNVDSKANYQGGDFVGLKTKIDEGYLDNLGINALWITPQIDNTSNAEYGTDGRLYAAYHGYWPISPNSPEPTLGTSAELKALVESAHKKGIRVLFDLVANHVHNQHPYYTQHLNDGWFNPYSLCTENDGWNKNPIKCWFDPFLPDINYQNPSALHQMVDDAVATAKTYDIDGFRVDAAKHMENCYLYHLSTNVENQLEHNIATAQMQFYLVGETFAGMWSNSCDGTMNCPQALIKYYINDRMLDGQFDFPLYWQTVSTFARNESTMADLNSMLNQDEDYWPASATMSNFLGNHDVARFISHANGDISDIWGSQAKTQAWTNPPSRPSSYVPYQRLQMAFAFLATVRGIPLAYYGDEIGMPGAGDPDNRRFMYFGSSLTTNESNTLAYIQKLLRAREQYPSLRSSNRIVLLGTDADALVYGKAEGTQKAVVAFNRSGTQRSLSVNVSGMNLTGTLTEVTNNSQVTVSGSTLSLSVPAYSALIYVQ